jgi:hypothetical protein
VPASIKLAQQYGGDIAVIFCESQGHSEESAEAFAWRQKWMGTGAMWTSEPPVTVTGNTLPKFALLGIDGELLISGNPLDLKKQIEETIEAQVKLAKAAPAGTPAKLSKAWQLFAKGDIGAALVECDKQGTGDAGLAESAKSMHTEIASRVNSKIARAKWLRENGYVSEATALVAGLTKSVKGCTEFDAAIAKEQTELATPSKDAGPEAEAAKALATIVNKMTDKPFEDANVKALSRLADKYKGTKAAERAAHLVELSKVTFK